MSYHRQRVEILIDKDSGLYERIAERAARDGVTVESVVEMLMLLGSHLELEKKLDMMERMERKK